MRRYGQIVQKKNRRRDGEDERRDRLQRVQRRDGTRHLERHMKRKLGSEAATAIRSRSACSVLRTAAATLKDGPSNWPGVALPLALDGGEDVHHQIAHLV
jgi:hypothetical protein